MRQPLHKYQLVATNEPGQITIEVDNQVPHGRGGQEPDILAGECNALVHAGSNRLHLVTFADDTAPNDRTIRLILDPGLALWFASQKVSGFVLRLVMLLLQLVEHLDIRIGQGAPRTGRWIIMHTFLAVILVSLVRLLDGKLCQ